MLLPQYSVRKVLAIMVACAAVFAVVALGLNGSLPALGFTIGLAAVVLLLGLHAVLFCGVWLLGLASSTLRSDPAELSPFRAETPELAARYGRHLPMNMAADNAHAANHTPGAASLPAPVPSAEDASSPGLPPEIDASQATAPHVTAPDRPSKTPD